MHEELNNIVFVQGWTTETLNKIGIINYFDAQHSKKSVIEEFQFITRQIMGIHLSMM